MDDRLNSLQALDVAHNLHSFTNLVEHKAQAPKIISRGKGIYVYDESGREFLDSGAGFWSVSLGCGQKRLVDAATRQMETLPYRVAGADPRRECYALAW
jgi:4-aminobutyrate---pyruvate transaminase